MSWTLIEHQALTSSVASVTLGSGGTIPQTYKTLKLVVSLRTTATGAAGDNIQLRANGTTSGNQWSVKRLSGDGGAVSSDGGTALNVYNFALASTATTTSNTFASMEVTIPNYSGTANKPMSADGVSENNATTAYAMISAGLYASSSAITSIVLASNTSADFVSGSTFTLYGLA